MTSLAHSLVGRDTELNLLDRLLDEACEGSSRFVVVTGEPGIGKTALLAELLHRAEERGCLVLEGRASEMERELPFGLVVDAFDPYLEALDPQRYERLATDGLGELASVFPALRSLGAASEEPSTATERFRAHHAVRELIERLAATQPLVLALDDVHWSDGASLELIAHLVRRRPEAAVLVAASFRTGQAGATLSGALEAAIVGGEIERVALGPLEPDEADRLLAAGADGDRDRLYRESGGNPFYLLQLARSAEAGDVPAGYTDGDGSAGVPPAVTAAIARELAGLAAPVRHFAEAASVAGDPFELDLAVAAGDMTEADALAALDELVARDLLRPTDVPRRFRFRHPLVRAAVYASCSPGVRLTAHERSATALAERGASAAARAHHVEQSARHGDTEAVAVLREAGRSAARRAPTSAARWFEAALRLLPDRTEPGERAELLVGLAEANAATGHLEASRAALLETIELSGGAEPGLISACAAVEQLLGRHHDAHARLQSALDELPGRDSAEAVSLMIDLAWDACLAADYERMREWGTAALEAARPLGDPTLTATAAAIAATAGASSGAAEEAEALRAEALTIVDALSDEVLAKRPHSLQWLSASEVYLGRFEEGIVHARRGMAVARASGQGELLPGMTQALGGQLIITGRLSEAAELLDGAVDAARLTDNAFALSWALGSRSFAAMTEGDVETAVATGEEAVAVTRRLEHGFIRARASGVVAAALFQNGEPERAADLLAEGTGGEEMALVPGSFKLLSLDVLTRCRLALGQQADAERAAATAQEIAARFGLPYCRALADRASAAVALAAGDAGTAAELALTSAAHAEGVGARPDAAMARVLAGRALARAGDTDRGAAELERAASEFEACGALRYRDEAEHELRKLGRTVHRRTKRGVASAEGVESLTGRELELARLVVARRTNPQIAAELFLSIKTVEAHLRNIFRKLDAGSRVDVARIVERFDAR